MGVLYGQPRELRLRTCRNENGAANLSRNCGRPKISITTWARTRQCRRAIMPGVGKGLRKGSKIFRSAISFIKISRGEGLISVIVAFLTAERFIAETIESVIGQTYENWELILVDDGSSDRGTAIVRSYEECYPGRIRYLDHPGHKNFGMCTSRNLAVRHSRGEFIAVLDSDDIWLPQKLEEQVECMKTYPGAALVYGRSEYWYDWTGDPSDTGKNFIDTLAPGERLYQAPELLLLCNLGHLGQPPPSDFLLRREALLQVGGFEEAFDPEHQMYEDQALLTKIYLHFPVYVSSKCWDRYRIHEKSLGAVSDAEGRSQATRRFYVQWLAKYLRSQGVKDAKIWKAYWSIARYDRFPLLGKVAGAVRPFVHLLRKRQQSKY